MATELVTYSNSGGESTHKGFASGLLTSDGTTVDIITGFTPAKIVLYNYTGTNPNIYTWVAGLASTNTFLLTGSTGVVTKGVTGPTLLGDQSGEAWDGTGGSSNAGGAGFNIPAALLSDGDTVAWEAWR